MKRAIIVFLTKTEVFECIDMLNLYGIKATTTATPKEAGIGCGLAVEVSFCCFSKVGKLLSERHFSGFVGIYVRENHNDRVSTYKIT